MAGPLITAPDIRSLAAKLEIPASVAEESVDAWNNFLISNESKDPLTGRVQFHPPRRPIEATHQCWPVSLRREWLGICLTCGGFTTTKSMQVVDIWGKPIPGLYAAGDCAGGLTPTAEMGGTHLGRGFVLGWDAGRAAATGRELAEPHKPGCFGYYIGKDENVKLNMPIIGRVDAAQQNQKL